jgi:hypothetical protein
MSGEVQEGLYEQFVRAEWTSDTPEAPPVCEQTIYRAHYVGTDPLAGLSWTTSLETAKWFAEYLTSPRAAFLGMRRGRQTQITVAVCDRFLARFSHRGEHEVIPDRSRVVICADWNASARQASAHDPG